MNSQDETRTFVSELLDKDARDFLNAGQKEFLNKCADRPFEIKNGSITTELFTKGEQDYIYALHLRLYPENLNQGQIPDTFRMPHD